MSENYATEIFLDAYKPLILERLRYSGTPDAEFRERMENAVRFLYKHKVATFTFEPHPILVALAYIIAKRFEVRALVCRGAITQKEYNDSLVQDVHEGARNSARWLVTRGWWRPLHSYGRGELYFSILKLERHLVEQFFKNYHHFESES